MNELIAIIIMLGGVGGFIATGLTVMYRDKEGKHIVVVITLLISSILYMLIIAYTFDRNHSYEQTDNSTQEMKMINFMGCNDLADYRLSHTMHLNETYNANFKNFADTLYDVRCHR